MNRGSQPSRQALCGGQLGSVEQRPLGKAVLMCQAEAMVAYLQAG